MAYIPGIYYNGEFAKHLIFSAGFLLFIVGFLLMTPTAASKKKLRYDFFSIFFFLFLLSGFLGNAFNRNVNRHYFMILFYSSQLVIYLVFLTAGPRINIRYFLIIVASSSAVIAVIGVFQAYGINPFNLSQAAIPASTFINPNFAAHFIDLAWPLVFLLPVAKNNLSRGLQALFSFTIFYFIILLGSRGLWVSVFSSMLGLLLILGITRSLHKMNFRTFLVPMVACAAALACFLAMNQLHKPDSNAIIEKKLKSPANPAASSTHVRLTLWKNSLALMKENHYLSLGHGEMPFRLQGYVDYPSPMGFGPHRSFYQHPHNEYLRVAAEAGLPGLTFYLLAFLSIVYRFFLYLRRASAPSNLVIILFLSFGSLCVHSFFEFPQFTITSGSLFPVFLGLLSARLRGLRWVNIARFQVLRLLTVIFFTVMVFLSVLNIVGGGKYAEALNPVNEPASACRRVHDIYVDALKYLQYEPTLTLAYPVFFSYCFSQLSATISVLEKYYTDYPDYPRLWHQLAVLYFEKGSYDKALVFIRRIRERQPSEPLGNILYGLYLQSHGEPQKGKELITEGLRVDSSYQGLVDKLTSR